MTCKDACGNKFLFSFSSHTAKRRALEDGPWMVGHSLMILVSYDRKKELDALEFIKVPIWIRVFKLLMGMMNHTMAEIIGNEVGIFLDVDVEENGIAVGRYIRIKILIDIRFPIMRDVTIDIEEEGEEQHWCPFEYEFLPEFYHYCEVIGHIDKSCPNPIPLAERQFGKWLRVLPPKRRFSDESGGKRFQPGLRSSGDWRRDKEVRMRESGSEGRMIECGGQIIGGKGEGGKSELSLENVQGESISGQKGDADQVVKEHLHGSVEQSHNIVESYKAGKKAGVGNFQENQKRHLKGVEVQRCNGGCGDEKRI
jgi:hypothetical protein